MTRYPGIGGIENVTNLVVKQMLDDQYCEIDVLAHLRQEHHAGLQPVDSRVKVYYMPRPRKWGNEENEHYAETVLSQTRYDALIYQDSYAPTEEIVCRLCKKYKVPLYVFEHNTPLFKYRSVSGGGQRSGIQKYIRKYVVRPYKIWKERERRKLLLRSCSQYVVLSEKFIPEFSYYGLHSDKIIAINNPIEYRPISLESVSQKENIILTVCQLSDRKRVDLMIKMWAKMEHCGYRFVIVGDGKEREQLQDLVNSKSVQDVEFVGFADPLTYYRKSKIFWMTSSFEGWGMTLVESMQCGCVPVVYNTFSSLQDIVASERNGFIVPDGDASEFIAKTMYLMTESDRYREMSENAIHGVGRFDVATVIQSWYNLLGK